MAVKSSTLGTRLEAARKDLLDLGLRNPLISYRSLKSRGLEVIDELPAEVFRILVGQSKAMTFLPSPEKDLQVTLDMEPESVESLALDQPEEANDGTALRHTDTKLQTALASARLQSRLLSTYYAARTSIEEQGVNILYLALGMVTWFESDDTQEARRAPLILIPVALERSSARERFELRYSGDDIESNLSLSEKVRTEFRVTLPPLSEGEDLDVPAYLESVKKAIRTQKRWEVDDRAIALGFFSFAKLRMYRDLDGEGWPENERLENHPVLRALMQDGFQNDAFPIGEEDQVDDAPDGAQPHQVMDADSSQVLAIMQIGAGMNMVVQGPPGTGKSQTITNVIAEALARGRTVLFVSEKLAALEVVKRRLDHVGIGDSCLELHSHKANKKAILRELERTLTLGRPKPSDGDGDLDALLATRQRLNEYCVALNTPVGDSGVTPYRALGELLRMMRFRPSRPIPSLALVGMDSWAAKVFRHNLALVEELQGQLQVTGHPPAHLFWGSRRLSLLPSEDADIQAALSAAGAGLSDARAAVKRVSVELGRPEPLSPSEARSLLAVAHRVAVAPDVRGLALALPDWLDRERDARRAILSGAQLQHLHKQFDAVLNPTAWQADVTDVRATIAGFGGKWWRGLSGKYRSARQHMRELFRGAPPESVDAVLAALDAIEYAQREFTDHQRLEPLAAGLFGAQWRGAETDWGRLVSTLDFVAGVHREAREGRLQTWVFDALSSERSAGLELSAMELEAALAGMTNSIVELLALLEMTGELALGEMQLEKRPFAATSARIASWIGRRTELHDIVGLNHLCAACEADGLSAVVDSLGSDPEVVTGLVDAFRWSWYSALYERALRERPVLAQVDSQRQDQLAKKFRKLDRLTLELTRARIARAHWEQLPPQDGAGQLAVLRREFNKRARHLPIRKLMGDSGNAVQAIKPVFMMSPLSIAAYLAPASVKFDLVVFDEASQVKPVDAFGAIVRARQAVVVGDDQQLPPTSFFDSVVDADDREEDDVTGDIESILGLFRSQGAKRAMLKWHYRSRHESLIAVSNHEFYDDKLVVFPSPDGGRRELGLRYHHVPEGVYDRGKSRKNLVEAKVVAEAVMDHARAQADRPTGEQLTLGVVAFSAAQMEAIQEQLEYLRRQDDACEDFFAAHPHEPFFVKNLENVQGDERDVILISVGYGRNEEGYVAMAFGPVNRDGGERRLNVLITRARLRCEVFTNLTADDIDLERSNQRGVRALKTFLEYAATGRLGVPERTARDDDSPFEDAVYEALVGQGHDVHRQVGSAGFFIDLAVRDPHRPGRYLLGIECDGATYHSARSARDRDRLRQQVLEGLGWSIHRIWSTSWFRQPEKELKRLAEAIEAAGLQRKVADRVSEPRSAQSVAAEIVRELPSAGVCSSTAVPAYKIASLSLRLGKRQLHEVPPEELGNRVAEVVAAESPINIEEICRRVTDAAGLQRVGSRIHDAIERGCASAVKRGNVRKRGDFYWAPDMTDAPIRDRSSLPPTVRRLAFVAPEEVEAAIRKVVKDSCGIAASEIATNAVRLLGFGRCSADMKEAVDKRVRVLIRKGAFGDREVTS